MKILAGLDKIGLFKEGLDMKIVPVLDKIGLFRKG